MSSRNRRAARRAASATRLQRSGTHRLKSAEKFGKKSFIADFFGKIFSPNTKKK